MELAGNFTEENLKRFEKANGLRINTYLIGENKGEVDPYYLSDNEEGTPIHLELISKKDQNGIKFHYILIKDLANVAKPDYERSKHKFYVCERCLQLSQGEEALKNDKKYCYQEHVDLVLPAENKWPEFRHQDRSQWYPGCVFADFEATTVTHEGNVIQIPNSLALFCPELDILKKSTI
jgi:hypothetical protein